MLSRNDGVLGRPPNTIRCLFCREPQDPIDAVPSFPDRNKFNLCIPVEPVDFALQLFRVHDSLLVLWGPNGPLWGRYDQPTRAILSCRSTYACNVTIRVLPLPLS